MLNSLRVLLQGLAAPPTAAPERRAHAATRGPSADPSIYERNLGFIQQNVLPPGWRLNAVQKWDAHGHGIREMAAAAAAAGAGSLSFLYNWEARAAAGAGGPQRLLRIKPADYAEAAEAARAGWGVEELVGPGNLEEVAAAARDAGRPIGVHLYLFRHYGEPWGWDLESATQLQEGQRRPAAEAPSASLARLVMCCSAELAESMDRQQLPIRGIMAHVTGYPEDEKDCLVCRFLSVACPAARALAPARVAVHWADSTETLRTLRPDGRMRVPPEAAAGSAGGSLLGADWGSNGSSGCGGSGSRPAGGNVEFWARLGKLGFGADPAINRERLHGGVAPVMRWEATVASIGWEDVVGQRRLVATVDLSSTPGRYPAPSCLLRVDVTDAVAPVRPGDTVCLLGDERGLKDLADEMGADYYNVALCLRGSPPMEGSDWWPPSCVLPL
ncbi:hypothetical protein ABPG75_011595 [Micractinium tetrahymenae]